LADGWSDTPRSFGQPMERRDEDRNLEEAGSLGRGKPTTLDL